MLNFKWFQDNCYWGKLSVNPNPNPSPNTNPNSKREAIFFGWNCPDTTWNTVNTNWRMKCFFLILPECNSMLILQLQNWYSKCNSKWICLSARNGRAKLKVHFYLKRYCIKFILTVVLTCLQSSFLIQHGKKAKKKYIIIIHMFLSLQETS